MIGRKMMLELTLKVQDPHTRGVVLDDAEQTVDVIPFDFYTEDADLWNRLADDALRQSGYVRTSLWTAKRIRVVNFLAGAESGVNS